MRKDTKINRHGHNATTSNSVSQTRGRRILFQFLLSVLATCCLVPVLAACGGDDARLEAAKLTLDLRYPHSGPAQASVSGQPEAAPGGAKITCRSARDGEDERELGEGEAENDGSFVVEIDADAYPLEALAGQFYELNQTLECRAGDGDWVHPLRPPNVAIE
jgi:hypothetical protein